jgi:sugar/nucleoside kinase (ribokinase family)
MSHRNDKSGSGTLVFAGLLTLDVAQFAAALPELGGKGTADAAYMDVGGPAANAAVTAAAFGAETLLHTVVGSGQQADFIRRSLDGYEVDFVDHAPAAAVPLASVWVLAGTGERTILATNNARLALEPSGRLLPKGTVAVLLDGHYPDLARRVATAATADDVPIVLDCGRWRPVFSELLPLASEVIMCESFHPPGLPAASSEELVAAVVAEWGTEVCAMSRGSRAVLLAYGGELQRLPVPQVAVVDTTGAGDVLHGAYMFYRFGAGLEPVAALSRSVAMASESCTHLAVRPGVVTAN